MIPLLGLTQYLRGAVVFTLKHTFRSVGLPSFRLVVTTSVKGPVERGRDWLDTLWGKFRRLTDLRSGVGRDTVWGSGEVAPYPGWEKGTDVNARTAASEGHHALPTAPGYLGRRSNAQSFLATSQLHGYCHFTNKKMEAWATLSGPLPLQEL